jgi:hypothetical protein
MARSGALVVEESPSGRSGSLGGPRQARAVFEVDLRARRATIEQSDGRRCRRPPPRAAADTMLLYGAPVVILRVLLTQVRLRRACKVP